jgi:hypothetical protein
MLTKIPSPLIVFGVLAAAVVASVASVAPMAARQAERAVASPAAPGRAGTAHAAPAIPTVAKFYALPLGDVAGLRVSFLQDADVLTAVWMTPKGDIYGHGTYRWDAAIGAFTGTSTTVNHCLTEDGVTTSSFQYQVREQLYVVNDRELRDRFTKPLDVDCSVGLVEKYKWSERQWLATDKDWKPLDPRSGGRY